MYVNPSKTVKRYDELSVSADLSTYTTYFNDTYLPVQKYYLTTSLILNSITSNKIS